MNYAEALDYLYYKLPMYQREGNVTIRKISLKPTQELCKALGNPQENFPSVHIAGTNGKGSVSHMICAVLMESGYKTGIYTSPHYVHFGERIKINGQFIPEDKVIEFIEENEVKWKGRRTSFFELTVGMAFHHFSEMKVDYAVIETGLGGRLDSTNIINPEISVITNISMDHAEVLGNTIEEIAFEKAGIIKPNTPVIVGRRNPNTDHVFLDRAKANNSPIYFAEDLFEVELIRSEYAAAVYKIVDKLSGDSYNIRTDLTAGYQRENIRTCLASMKILAVENNIGFIKPTIKRAFENIKATVRMMGRWDILSEKPLIIADSAHNEDGIDWALKQINTLEFKELHIVMGFVKEKDLKPILSRFPENAHYYFTQAQIPRALNANDLKNQAMKYHLKGFAYETVSDALKSAKSVAGKNDLIMVLGSIFVVAEVYA